MSDGPEIDIHSGYYRFTWTDLGVQVKVSRLREQKDATSAELLFVKLGQEFDPDLEKYRARVNLLAPRSVKELATHVSPLFPLNGFNWTEALNLLAYNAVNLFRKGEPYEVVSSADPFHRAEYLVFPFVPKNHSAILFGLGGVGKSLFALALGIVAQHNLKHNKLGMIPKEKTNVLYLDWESYKDEFQWRVSSLCKGFKIPEVKIGYRRGIQPLADDIEAIQELVYDHQIGLVIIDSIGAACAGDLNRPEFASTYMNALRGIGVSSLSIGHPPKNVDDHSHHTVMGHSTFTNLGRLIWEVESPQEVLAEDEDIVIALTNTKSNIDRKHLPRAYALTIDNDLNAIDIRQIDIADTAFNSKLPLSTRILGELRLGPLTCKQLAERLLHKMDSVSATLYQMRRKDKIVALGERHDRRWGISADAIDDRITTATFGVDQATLWKDKDV